MDLIYTFACIYFVYSIKNLFKTKKLLYIIFLVLLFNPVSYACWTFQRVYRSGITISQVLIIIASLFKIYENRFSENKKIFIHALIGGITLGAMYHTREDGIWILPFVFVVTLITLISIIFKYKKNYKKEFMIKIFIILLPFIILFGSIQTVRSLNYIAYGVYTYNELNDGYLGKSIQAIYSVKTDENIDKVSATRQKLKSIYEISPTLKSIEPELENAMDIWGEYKGTSEKQVDNGIFWWAYKSAVEAKGYYENASKSNEFYKNVTNEINQAIKSGKLKSQLKMPATLMAPWKEKYLLEEFSTICEVIDFTTSYEQVSIGAISNDNKNTTNEQIREYEVFTNSFAIYKERNACIIEGFYSPKKNQIFKLKLENQNGELITELKLENSEDIYNTLKGKGYIIEQATKCRFSYSEDLEKEYNKLYLVAFDEKDNIIEKIEIGNNEKIKSSDSETSFYAFKVQIGKIKDPKYYASLESYNILQLTKNVYEKTGRILAIIAILIYIVKIAYFFLRDSKNKQTLHLLLLLTGIMLTYMMLIAGIAYNHISATNSKLYMYLSGAYPLQLAFISITITSFIFNIKEYFKNK